MKKLILSIILAVVGIVFSIGIIAQPPPAPPTDPTLGGNQTPGPAGPAGAPIEPGTGILLLLATGYCLKKFEETKKTRIKSE
jgi:hypothetical protein